MKGIRARHEAREVEGEGQDAREVEPEVDEWSDEESDYIVKVPTREQPAEPFDVTATAVQPKIVHADTHSEDYRRSHDHRGDARIHQIRALLPREVRQPLYASFRLPLPYLPAHVRDSLGDDIVEHLWAEFLLHDADASELIQVKQLKSVAQKMQMHLGYKIPLDEIKFPGLESDDFIDFKAVVLQLVLHGDKQQRKIKFAPPPNLTEVLGRCCAIDACMPVSNIMKHGGSLEESESVGSGSLNNLNESTMELSQAETKPETCRGEGEEEEKEEEEEEEEEQHPEHSLHVAYLQFRLERHGRVRVKHICDLMDLVKLPYDKSRIPSAEWAVKGELLLTSNEQAQELCERIRTDKDYERNSKKDDIYFLPRWMEEEFSPSEVMLFKHQFHSIDIDGGGTLDADELMLLTQSMGNPVTKEQAQDIIALVDTSDKGSINFSEFMMLMYKIQNGVIDLSGNFLAQAMVEAKSQIPIFDEIEGLHSDPPPLAHVIIYGGSPVQCDIAITGPPGTPYEGGTFTLRVVLLNGYPFRTPTVTFLTRLYHINVLTELDGMGYLPHIKHMWDSSWSLRSLCAHIVELFRQPRLDFIPIEFTRIIKVFLWEEKEKRRIAEEERLAELARLAELSRLEEEARLAAEQAARDLATAELASMRREWWQMSGEDRENETEMEGMAAEDRDCPEKDEDSVGTFTSDLDDADMDFEGDKGGDKEEGASSPRAAERKELQLEGGDAQGKADDDWATESGRKSARSVTSALSHQSQHSGGGRAGMPQADAKAPVLARRDSKASVHSQLSRQSKSGGRASEEDEEQQQQKEQQQKEEEEEEEEYEGPSSADLLGKLMRCEQMHLVVVQFYTDTPHEYERHAKEYVKMFAWTTHHDEEGEKEGEEGDAKSQGSQSVRSQGTLKSQASGRSQQSHVRAEERERENDVQGEEGREIQRDGGVGEAAFDVED